MKRERFLNLSKNSYLISKVAVLFGISAIQTGLFVLISCLILEINGQWFSFWLVMFSVACVSTMMGLNVSSAFKSAATVYILIPLLLIPQLILSGVVVPFDRFSPRYANNEKVPFLGDWIASRWAFEALMVEFYINNEYGHTFYELDKDESTSRYYSLFYLESLRSKLDKLRQNLLTGSIQSEDSRHAMRIVRNEVEDQLKIFGKDQLPEFENLTVDSFNSSAHMSTINFLNALHKVHVNRRDRSVIVKDSLTQILQANGTYGKLKVSNHNEELSTLVRNTYSSSKILDGKNYLVRKFEPIFSESKPRHFFDYRTSFYAPTKHLAGGKFSTLYFNVVVLWVMVFMFYGTLYFNVPEKTVNGIGKLTRKLV